MIVMGKWSTVMLLCGTPSFLCSHATLAMEFCEAPGSYEHQGTICHYPRGTTPSTPQGPSPGSGSSGDTRGCISIQSDGPAEYKAVNSCPHKVLFVVETKENDKMLTRDNLSVDANDTEHFIFSYHEFRPVVLSACRDGSPGCK